MKYHCKPDLVSLNLELVDDVKARTRMTNEVKEHIFVKKENIGDIARDSSDVKCYTGFDPAFEMKLQAWEEGRRPKMGDV